VIPKPDGFYCVTFFSSFSFFIFYSCITSPSQFFYLLLPSSLSLLFLCYNPLFSLPATLSAPSHPFFPLSLPLLLTSSNLSPHYFSFLHTHHLLTSLLYQLYTTPVPFNPWHKHTVIDSNTHKGHKIQQLPYLFPYPPTTFPIPPVLVPLLLNPQNP
jgi:hypothetical protein